LRIILFFCGGILHFLDRERIVAKVLHPIETPAVKASNPQKKPTFLKAKTLIKRKNGVFIALAICE